MDIFKEFDSVLMDLIDAYVQGADRTFQDLLDEIALNGSDEQWQMVQDSLEWAADELECSS